MKETELVDGALRSVEARLPAAWRLDLTIDGKAAFARADGIAVLTGPAGAAV